MALTHSLGAVQPQTEPEPRPLNADDDGATRMLKAMTRTTDYRLLTTDYGLLTADGEPHPIAVVSAFGCWH